MNTDVYPIVVKSNALINAMLALNLQGLRFFAFAISLLDRTQPVPPPGQYVDLEIPVLEFAEAFGLDSKSAYREVELLADQLQQKIIQLDPDQTLDGSRVKVGLITKQKYLDGAGRVWLRFDEDLVPHLLDLGKGNFTQYRIKDVYQFSRVSTWRMYELLRQYKMIGKREIDLEELHWKLALHGKYPRVTSLRQWVIDPAVEEINAMSDLYVQYEQKKRGRTVAGFVFTIQENQGTRTPREKVRAAAEKLDSGKEYAPELARRLREDCQVAPKQARQIANLAHGEGRDDEISAMLPRLKARFEKIPAEKRKTTLGGYIFKALRAELMPKDA